MVQNQLFTSGDKNAIWGKYCGFFDLSIKEFMEIQENLLLEEIGLVSDSPLGKKIMNNRKPKNTQDFRRFVPLTTYEDYAPYIGNCQEDALTERSFCWARTSGRGGNPKWVPLTRRAYERLGIYGVMVIILACASKKGEICIKEGTRFMQNLPPRPYYTGVAAAATLNELSLHILPPLEQSEKMTFEERIKTGFNLALRGGVDVLGSLTSVLIKMGERFTDSSQRMKLSSNMLQPTVMWRLIRALLRAKIEKRTILPKDLWPLKGLLCYGMDTSIYREELKYYWGKEPLEIYGGTEMAIGAVQSWTRKGLTFTPFFTFFEFIPEEEWLKGREDRNYQPSTVLLNQVEKGKRYELVITNFYGMPLLRYRVGDLVKIVDLQDEQAGIQIPQMVFDSRADDLIDIGGFTRLDEKTVWQAIVNAEIKYEDWTIRKEYEKEKAILKLYIEPKDEINRKDAEYSIHKEIVAINEDYRDLEGMLDTKPLKVVLLPKGTFQRYYEEKRKAGVDLSHLKPPHMNASDQVIEDLLRLTKARDLN